MKFEAPERIWIESEGECPLLDQPTAKGRTEMTDQSKKINPRHLEHPRFYTNDGWLTPYALACGYVEQKDYGPIRITLFHDGGCYHVQAYDHDQKIRRFWESFRTLTEARRHYKYAEALLVAGSKRLGE